jgi:hypothetical protein
MYIVGVLLGNLELKYSGKESTSTEWIVRGSNQAAQLGITAGVKVR